MMNKEKNKYEYEKDRIEQIKRTNEIFKNLRKDIEEKEDCYTDDKER